MKRSNLSCVHTATYTILFGMLIGASGCVSTESGGAERLTTRRPASTSQDPNLDVTETNAWGREEVLRFNDIDDGSATEVPIYKLGPRAYGFVAGLQIDVDGSSRAYHPDDIGLDYLANAGMPILDNGRKLRIDKDWQKTWREYYARARQEAFRGPTHFEWHGIVTDDENVPVVQHSADPDPGYYVSQTSLTNRSVANECDPRRYVDSVDIPYLALPPAVLLATGVRVGDIAAVVRPDNNALAYAIVADIGLSTQLGEGSVRLAQDLGHNPIRPGNPPRAIIGLSKPLCYLLFPGSGTGDVMSPQEIEADGSALFRAWGNLERLRAELTRE